MFLRGQFSYTGESDTLLVPEPLTDGNPSFTNGAYTLADLRWGLVSGDGAWEIDLFVNNVTDERAELFQNTGEFEWAFMHSTQYDRFHRVFTNRPREYGLRYFKGWGD